MSGKHYYTTLPARCKFLHTPGWDEVLAIGRGVTGGCKSRRSHKQGQRADAHKSAGRRTGSGIRQVKDKFRR